MKAAASDLPIIDSPHDALMSRPNDVKSSGVRKRVVFP